MFSARLHLWPCNVDCSTLFSYMYMLVRTQTSSPVSFLFGPGYSVMDYRDENNKQLFLVSAQCGMWVRVFSCGLCRPGFILMSASTSMQIDVMAAC